jgi:hypothetical protein
VGLDKGTAAAAAVIALMMQERE